MGEKPFEPSLPQRGGATEAGVAYGVHLAVVRAQTYGLSYGGGLPVLIDCLRRVGAAAGVPATGGGLGAGQGCG